jgi:hypothetical protein
VKLRSDSFSARLTADQRDDIFAALAGGISIAEACARIKELTGKKPSGSAVSVWLTREGVRRRYELSIVAAAQASASCPKDADAQARRAVAQAKFAAVHSATGLSPEQVAQLERNEIARQRLELDRERHATDQRVARRDITLDRARLLLERSRGGETGADLQAQIDLALAEIQNLKHGGQQ